MNRCTYVAPERHKEVTSSKLLNVSEKYVHSGTGSLAGIGMQLRNGGFNNWLTRSIFLFDIGSNNFLVYSMYIYKYSY